MTEEPNGLARALRSKTFYVVLLSFFLMGALAGWYVTTVRSTCQRLVAEQRRQAVAYSVLALAATQDEDINQAQAWRSFAAAARDVEYPRC